nr:cbb3-type cytochrome c oxidase subunit II [Chthoniobacterales bacterium]
MKGLLPLVLGIFGTFAFSWAGLTVIPNAQIGHLSPQMDEEGNDPYPAPKSGMADHGRKIYAANGCVYCHSQQVRPDYAASDIDRKWGNRRSAPRDYLFEQPALLGKMRMGPDLANVGKRAPVDDENAPPPGSTAPTT